MKKKKKEESNLFIHKNKNDSGCLNKCDDNISLKKKAKPLFTHENKYITSSDTSFNDYAVVQPSKCKNSSTRKKKFNKSNIKKKAEPTLLINENKNGTRSDNSFNDNAVAQLSKSTCRDTSKKKIIDDNSLKKKSEPTLHINRNNDDSSSVDSFNDNNRFKKKVEPTLLVHRDKDDTSSETSFNDYAMIQPSRYTSRSIRKKKISYVCPKKNNLNVRPKKKNPNFRSKKKNPYVLPKNYLLQAVEMISQPKSVLVGKKAKITALYCPHRTNLIDAFCADRSHLSVYGSYLLYTNQLKRISGLLEEMRLCLLASDWDGYRDLLLMFTRMPNVSRTHTLFAIRSSFILLFNHPNRTPQLLDNFMRTCLYINDHSRRIIYLENCFLLKGTSVCSIDKTVLNREDDDEEEEEIIFNPDFSSDDEIS